MPRVQIFRDPETGKPTWAVVHDAPTDPEEAFEIVEKVEGLLSTVGGEGTYLVVSTSEIPVEVL